MPKRTGADTNPPPDTDLQEGLERALIAGALSRRGFIQALTAAGLASAGVAALADELDAETLRNSASRDLFTNPAKVLADRFSAPSVVLAGHDASTSAMARHAASVLLRVAQKPAAAVTLADTMVALRRGLTRVPGDLGSSIFHDEEFDGPLPARVRTIVLTTDEERPAVLGRLSGYDDVTTVSAGDVGEVTVPAPGGRLEQQLAMLAVRLEMAAVYLRLVRG
jgi:hypothetical protein